MAALPPDEIAYQKAHITEDRGPLVVGISSLLIALSAIAVALRFFARHKRQLRFEWDDWLSLVGFVLIAIQGAVNFISVKYGLGKHLLAVDPTKIYKILQAGLFNALVYGLVHWCIKMSILYLYKRIFTLHTFWFKIAVYTCAAYTTGWLICEFFGALFQCKPVSFFWEQFNPANKNKTGYCGLDNATFAEATSILNTVGDFAILFLPVTMLWQLQLQTARKLSLIGVFATGVFACVAGILRLLTTITSIQPGADTTWLTSNIYLWTMVEAAVGLICACMPVIGPLFAPLRDKTKSYWSKRSRAVETTTKPPTAGRSVLGSSTFGAKAPFGRLDGDEPSDPEDDTVQLRPMNHIRRTDEVVIERSYEHMGKEKSQW